MAKTEKLSDDVRPVILGVGDTVSLTSSSLGSNEGASLFTASVEQFVILQPLGKGGMGTVFLAYDTQLHRHVALKLISEDLQSHGDSWQGRLLQEARTMAKINHAHVVPIHSVGLMDENVYIAMAHVEGGTLKDWLQAPRSPNQILDLLLPIADALAVAHKEGVVHRDIKPQNILVRKDEHAFLTDFGIAATLSKDNSPVAVEGTREYMAPEQATGNAPDLRSDIYSYCLTIQRALQGKGSRSVQRALTKGCEAKPSDRYLTMDEVQRELRKARHQTRRRSLTLVALLAVLAAFALFLYSRPSAVPAMCVAQSTQLKAIWNTEREATLRSQFQATGAVDATRMANRSVQSIDLFVEQWRSQRHQNCEATHVHRQQSEDVLIARQDCYRRRLGELSAVLDTLTPETVLLAENAIPTPRSLDLCTPSSVLQRRKRSVLTGPKAQAVGESLAKLRSLHSLGQYQQGLQMAQSLRSEVEALDSEQHLAEFELVVSRHYKTLYRAKDAWAHLQAANLSAARAGDNELVAKVWTQAIFVLGYQLGRNGEAEIAAVAAQAAVEQSRASDAVRSNFLTKLAILRRTQYRWEESESLQKKGLSLRREYYGRTHPLVGKSASNLGNLLIDMGKYEEAASSQKLATQIARQAYGGGNPALADTLANYVSTIMTIGKHSQALPLQKEVLTIFQAAHGSTSKKALEAQVGLALLHTYLGNVVEARASIVFVRDAMSKAAVDINRAGWLVDLARTELLLGNVDQAREDLAKVSALHSQFPGSRHALSTTTDLLFATLEAEWSRCDQALPYLSAVQVRLADLPNRPSLDRAITMRTKASCLLQSGERTAAQLLFSQSIKMMRALGVTGYELSLTMYYHWQVSTPQSVGANKNIHKLLSARIGNLDSPMSLSDILLTLVGDTDAQAQSLMP